MPAFYHLIETFPITGPGGAVWTGWLIRSPVRRSGRQIIVTADRDGKEQLFDTEMAYDSGNAINKLEHWIAAQYEAAGQPLTQGVQT